MHIIPSQHIYFSVNNIKTLICTTLNEKKKIPKKELTRNPFHDHFVCWWTTFKTIERKDSLTHHQMIVYQLVLLKLCIKDTSSLFQTYIHHNSSTSMYICMYVCIYKKVYLTILKHSLHRKYGYNTAILELAFFLGK